MIAQRGNVRRDGYVACQVITIDEGFLSDVAQTAGEDQIATQSIALPERSIVDVCEVVWEIESTLEAAASLKGTVADPCGAGNAQVAVQTTTLLKGVLGYILAVTRERQCAVETITGQS